jgi:hypothetical protein
MRGWTGYRPPQVHPASEAAVFKQGLGLFGGPADASLLDEVVRIA